MSIELLTDRLNVIKALASLYIVRNEECPEAEYIGGRSFLHMKRKGLLFNIDLSCECDGYDKQGNLHHEWVKYERCNITIIVAKPHNVFVNLLNTKQIEDYKNTSNHNSCWRHDGLSSIESFAHGMYHRVYANKPKDKRPSMVNADFFIWDSSDAFMQPVEIITKDDSDRHKIDITDLQNIHMTDLFKKQKGIRS